MDVKKAVPTKDETKDTALTTIAIAAIPVGIGMIQAGQLVNGLAIAAIGVVLLVMKYKLRA